MKFFKVGLVAIFCCILFSAPHFVFAVVSQDRCGWGYGINSCASAFPNCTCSESSCENAGFSCNCVCLPIPPDVTWYNVMTTCGIGCDDNNQCTEDTCNGNNFCDFTDKANGAACTLAGGDPGCCQNGQCVDNVCNTGCTADAECPLGTGGGPNTEYFCQDNGGGQRDILKKVKNKCDPATHQCVDGDAQKIGECNDEGGFKFCQYNKVTQVTKVKKCMHDKPDDIVLCVEDKTENKPITDCNPAWTLLDRGCKDSWHRADLYNFSLCQNHVYVNNGAQMEDTGAGCVTGTIWKNVVGCQPSIIGQPYCQGNYVMDPSYVGACKKKEGQKAECTTVPGTPNIAMDCSVAAGTTVYHYKTLGRDSRGGTVIMDCTVTTVNSGQCLPAPGAHCDPGGIIFECTALPPATPPGTNCQGGQQAVCQSGKCVCVAGSGKNQCESDDDCKIPTPPTGSHTSCANHTYPVYEGLGGSFTKGVCMSVAGAGKNQCSTNGDCAVTPNEPQEHTVCGFGGQCYTAAGAGSNVCQSSSDCPHPCTGHTECVSGQCVCQTGIGRNQCTSDKNCPPSSCDSNQHTECANGQCLCQDGAGNDQCSTGNDCPPPNNPPNNPPTNPICNSNQHSECSNGQCICQTGAGSNQCSTGSDCPPPACENGGHTECESGQCVCQSGAGSNQCSTSGDCPPPNCAGHTECVEGQCLCQDGAGEDQCSDDGQCEPSCSGHTECVDNQCVCQNSQGSDQCSSDDECKPTCNQGKHTECQNGKCNCVNGAGDNQCSGDQDCPTPCDSDQHTSCVYGKCVCQDGAGINQCTSNGDCPTPCEHETRCQNGQCICGGSGAICSSKDDCSPNCLYTKCVYGVCACQNIGSRACSSSEECPIICSDVPAEQHATCVNGACVCQPGEGADQCSDDDACLDVATVVATVNNSNKSAMLTGELEDMVGCDTATVHFEWGLTIAYGNQTVSQEMTAPGPFEAPTTTGLQPGTYHFRAVAECGTATAYGVDKTFILNNPPEIRTMTATVPDYCTAIPGAGIVYFSWIYYDAENNTESKYKLEIDDNSNFSSPEFYKEFTNTSYPSGTTNRIPVFVKSGTPNCNAGSGSCFIKYGTTYYWRVTVEDSTGLTTQKQADSVYVYPYAHAAPAPLFVPPTGGHPTEPIEFVNTNFPSCRNNSNQPTACQEYVWYWDVKNHPADYNSTSDQSIEHTYPAQGTYLVELDACDEVKCCGYQQGVPVKSEGAGELPNWKEVSPF